MKRVISSIIAGFCFTCLATERTWTGGGSDSNWSTADNWGGTAPAAGDSLVFSGSTRLANTNDFSAGTSFAGIAFSNGAGAFMLDGNMISLAGDLISEDNSYQTFNLPIELSGDTIISNDVSGGRIVLNGQISGSGGITKDGAEYLQITASNSYDGVTLIKRGYLLMKDAFACGSTNGVTTVNRVEDNTGILVIDGDGMDIYEPLEFRNLNANGSCLFTRDGSNTLHSTFTIQGGRYYFNSGTTLVFKKGVSRIGNPFFVLNGYGTVIFDDKVDIGTAQFYADSPTKVYLNVSSNIWGSTTLANGELIMNAVNALPANAYIRLALGYAPRGTLNLNGYDQTISYIYNDTASAGDKIVKSDTPAVLTLSDSGTREFIADFKGAAGLRKGGQR